MEFREKLQLLRTNMKLSQEELANKLDISRQSITKWENGQSFPDIQNLIQLSEIFKVSIDRLVKENDTCMVSLFCNENYPKQDIRIFLVRAKNNTYAVGENEVLPSKPNSHDFRYVEDDYLYIDSYFNLKDHLWTLKAVIVTSIIIACFTQGNIGEFTLVGSIPFYAVLVVLACISVSLSIHNVEVKDVL